MLLVEASSIPPSLTESKFSTTMPYLESDHVSDNVFLDTETSDTRVNQHSSQSPTPTESTVTSSPPETPEQLPVPRRSARSTWGAPPVHLGKVITHSTRVLNMTNTPTYKQILYISCMPNIVLT